MTCSVDYTKYPHNWKKASQAIRRLANGQCEWCGSSAHDLSVHHLGAPYADGRPGDPRDKHDLRRENLCALCFQCNNGAERIGAIRKSRARQKARRRAKLEQHRALGIGTGLVLIGRASV